MTPQDFEFIAAELKRRSGIALTSDKGYLLETRLKPIARKNGCADLSEYANFLRKSPAGAAAYTELVESMTTNESMFFRDNKPFEVLKNTIIPELVKKNASTKRIRMWNAACSNGQEPYSAAITLQEEKHKAPGFSFDITATDIDKQVLDKAQKGVYSQFEVQRGMPIQLLLKYFTQKDGNQWELNPDIRRMVYFKQLNLMDNYISLGRFDIIFCRNVLIYFDRQTKSDILGKLAGCLNPNGYLILGSTETAMGLCDKLKASPAAPGTFVLA